MKETDSQNVTLGYDSQPQNAEDIEENEGSLLPEETIIALVSLGQILRKINARMSEMRYNKSNDKLSKNEYNDQ